MFKYYIIEFFCQEVFSTENKLFIKVYDPFLWKGFYEVSLLQSFNEGNYKDVTFNINPQWTGTQIGDLKKMND